MSEQEKIVTPSIEQPMPNAPVAPEQPASIERPTEKTSDAPVAVASDAPSVPAQPNTKLPMDAQVERVAEIERILESDLSTVYFNLPDDKREAFRARGEATAREINTMMSTAKLHAQKIIKLIKGWLLLIPGVNKFFLEQEAKLKADQIIRLNGKF